MLLYSATSMKNTRDKSVGQCCNKFLQVITVALAEIVFFFLKFIFL